MPRRERAKWQIKIQQQITGYVDTLFSRALITLGQQIKKSNNLTFYVFNPLSWSRSDVADVLYTGTFPVKVIDLTTGKEIASQVITKDDKQFLRVNVKNIPSVGYKVFEIRKGVPSPLPQAATVTGEYLNTSFYRIRLSKSGSITEIYDSVNSRQLVSAIDGKYVNDLGTGDIDDGEPVVIENAGPVSVTLKAVSRNPTLHIVRVTVFANNSRIEIEDSIQANYGDVKTWAFSFNLHNSTTRHEELGAILTVKKETRGGHYASQNARYDWQTFNHFADMSEKEYGTTLSNIDCSFFKLGKSTPDSLWEESPQLHALAGGQLDKSNYANLKDTSMLGIYNQNGQKDFHYQFALTTHTAFNATSAMKFSLEHQNPLVADFITGNKSGNSNNIFSLLSINNPNVLLWSIKPSEEGIENGLITRFWNLQNKSAQPIIKLNKPIERAWLTSHIETNEKLLKPLKGSLLTSFSPHQINSYRLLVDRK